MMQSVIHLPITVEQLAVAVEHLNVAERARLIQLAPKLRDSFMHSDQAMASVEAVRKELELLAPIEITNDTPFLNKLTWGEYQSLQDEEKNEIWVGNPDDYELEEVEVKPNALPAG